MFLTFQEQISMQQISPLGRISRKLANLFKCRQLKDMKIFELENFKLNFLSLDAFFAFLMIFLTLVFYHFLLTVWDVFMPLFILYLTLLILLSWCAFQNYPLCFLMLAYHFCFILSLILNLSIRLVFHLHFAYFLLVFFIHVYKRFK